MRATAAECNAANLIINHGWQGLLFDGDADNVTRGRAFDGTHPKTKTSPPQFVHAWITAENVNDLVSQAGFRRPHRFRPSLDVDGNDYWFLKALTCVAPSVIVVEFNAACGPDRAVTMPYTPAYRLDLTTYPYRCGASLAAFTGLAHPPYRLVGVQSNGFNAFFVRNGLGYPALPERSPQDCYRLNPRLAPWRQAQLDEILSRTLNVGRTSSGRTHGPWSSAPTSATAVRRHSKWTVRPAVCRQRRGPQRLGAAAAPLRDDWDWFRWLLGASSFSISIPYNEHVIPLGRLLLRRNTCWRRTATRCCSRPSPVSRFVVLVLHEIRRRWPDDAEMRRWAGGVALVLLCFAWQLQSMVFPAAVRFPVERCSRSRR